METETDCYMVLKFFFDHSSTSSSSWLGLLNRGSLRAQSPQSAADSQSGILSPTDSNCPGHLVILLSHTDLLPLFFCLFTQVYLFTDGSFEGQYITLSFHLLSCPFLPFTIFSFFSSISFFFLFIFQLFFLSFHFSWIFSFFSFFNCFFFLF